MSLTPTPSTAYLDAMRHAWAEVLALYRDGSFPLPRLVWRARALYCAAHREEISRQRAGGGHARAVAVDQ
jgi:hypothetical protein